VTVDRCRAAAEMLAREVGGCKGSAGCWLPACLSSTALPVIWHAAACAPCTTQLCNVMHLQRFVHQPQQLLLTCHIRQGTGPEPDATRRSHYQYVTPVLPQGGTRPLRPEIIHYHKLSSRLASGPVAAALTCMTSSRFRCPTFSPLTLSTRMALGQGRVSRRPGNWCLHNRST
jgi:hypothetical protein